MSNVVTFLIRNRNTKLRSLQKMEEIKCDKITTKVLQVITLLFLFKICGQSYKKFMLISYESKVVIWGIFQSGRTLES